MRRTDMPPAQPALVNGFSNAVRVFFYKDSRICSLKCKIVMPAPMTLSDLHSGTEFACRLESTGFQRGVGVGVGRDSVASPVSKR